MNGWLRKLSYDTSPTRLLSHNKNMCRSHLLWESSLMRYFLECVVDLVEVLRFYLNLHFIELLWVFIKKPMLWLRNPFLFSFHYVWFIINIALKFLTLHLDAKKIVERKKFYVCVCVFFYHRVFRFQRIILALTSF